MFCSNCGKELPGDALFCPSCGRQLSQPERSNLEQQPPREAAAINTAHGTSPKITAPMPPISISEQPSRRSPESRESLSVTIAACLAAVLLAGTAGMFFLADREAETTSSSSENAASEQVEQPSKESADALPEQNPERWETASPAPLPVVEYVLPESDYRAYSKSELRQLSPWELYVARNEIYARYGRAFSNKDLARYFNSCSWYREAISPEDFDSMESPLSSVEKQNVEAIRAVEEEKGSPYLQ